MGIKIEAKIFYEISASSILSLKLMTLSKYEGFVTPVPVWGSLFYYDERLRGKDIIILCEVIEHIDEYRLPKVMENIFEQYEPKVLIVTTPNSEYNEVYQMNESVRHKDHRFEWTRREFQEWCAGLLSRYRYSVEQSGIGQEVEGFGQPTQLVVFKRQVGEIND